MGFVRKPADRWHRDVPGARWFKGDLHIHTIDDIAGKRAKMPDGITGRPDDPEIQYLYARRFLRAAISKGVQVLGITPHSPRTGASAETSAVWRIVDVWNEEEDDDGVPFRNKVYAVFPGFEPSFEQGRKGMHLAFLFDPEIGRDLFIRIFDQVMGGVMPWSGTELQLANNDVEQSFEILADIRAAALPVAGSGGRTWDCVAFAPHIDGDKGLFKEQRAQVFDRFPFGKIAGLELCDEDMPQDSLKGVPRLERTVSEHRLPFFHSSDSYKVDEIGNRHTWFKLAEPRIEGLRQAFIASGSRMRLGYERDDKGRMREILSPPDVTIVNRPWLKSVEISEGASFFRSGKTNEPHARFDFSPDLTCVIGGSMTGKSTLLDGLRVHVNADMPSDANLEQQVNNRATLKFSVGSPEIALDCPGQDPTARPHERWPAVFYTQTELQSLAREPQAVEGILAKLAAGDAAEIEEREKSLRMLGGDLVNIADQLTEIETQLAEAEQALSQSVDAKNRLKAFAAAGIDELNLVSRRVNLWKEATRSAKKLGIELDEVLKSITGFPIPDIDSRVSDMLEKRLAEASVRLPKNWRDTVAKLREAKENWSTFTEVSQFVSEAITERERNTRIGVDRALASQGLDGSQINELQTLNRHASFLKIYESNRDEIRERRVNLQKSFDMLLEQRQRLTGSQRQALDRAIKRVCCQSNGRIKVERIDSGERQPLEEFIRGLSHPGITRWWNQARKGGAFSPQELLDCIDTDKLDQIKMSDAVAKSFRERLDSATRRRLQSIRCRDAYTLSQRVDDGRFRRLADLSGGQKVSLLLSLLLETNDNRPLVIDQPEDELDNRFVYEDVLPALRRLKGRRQIIIATHSANFVVNGDADQVILLEADDDHGHVELSGAIEDSDVRDAIIRTVDGGDEAFRLRQQKYGF